MIFDHLVIDDLREFNPPRDEVVYIRTLEEAMKLFEHNHVHINHLWLDYDLGGEDTTLPFVKEIASCAYHAEGEFTVDSCYIITMNPVGRNQLFGYVEQFAEKVIVLDPVANSLVNKIMWLKEM